MTTEVTQTPEQTPSGRATTEAVTQAPPTTAAIAQGPLTTAADDPAGRFLSNEQIVLAARRNISQGGWDYLVGGSESESTLRRNRLAFDRWGFRPRILRDVSRIDTSTTFLGEKLRIPAILAPVGALETFHPDGAVGSARGAAEFGTMQVVSSVTEPALEVTAASTDRGKALQLYIRGDEQWTAEMIERIKAAGYMAFCLTVDVAIYSRRERAMLGGWRSPSQRGAGVAQRQTFGAEVTWEKMARIKEMVGLPFMIKGIRTPEDADLAVQHGVDVIWVSNHGGRQLDAELGSLEFLPEVVDAVGGRAEIIVDGGVQRGSDIIKALCLGAKAVALGKLQGWGLGAGGAAGVRRMLEILENEMISAMGLLGVTSVDQLDRSYIRRAESVIPPHEMSMWVNMPGGQIK